MGEGSGGGGEGEAEPSKREGEEGSLGWGMRQGSLTTQCRGHGAPYSLQHPWDQQGIVVGLGQVEGY